VAFFAHYASDCKDLVCRTFWEIQTQEKVTEDKLVVFSADSLAYLHMGVASTVETGTQI
jgi:hypothetical protein